MNGTMRGILLIALLLLIAVATVLHHDRTAHL